MSQFVGVHACGLGVVLHDKKRGARRLNRAPLPFLVLGEDLSGDARIAGLVVKVLCDADAVTFLDEGEDTTGTHCDHSIIAGERGALSVLFELRAGDDDRDVISFCQRAAI